MELGTGKKKEGISAIYSVTTSSFVYTIVTSLPTRYFILLIHKHFLRINIISISLSSDIPFTLLGLVTIIPKLVKHSVLLL